MPRVAEGVFLILHDHHSTEYEDVGLEADVARWKRHCGRCDVRDLVPQHFRRVRGRRRLGDSREAEILGHLVGRMFFNAELMKALELRRDADPLLAQLITQTRMTTQESS